MASVDGSCLLEQRRSWMEASRWLLATIGNDARLQAILLVISAVLYLYIKRYRTYRRLRSGGLPTVFWRPRFVTFGADDDNRNEKLASRSITRMLPRMQRLQGPMDMYGTVYGLSTAVVHVADPRPATAILCGTYSNTPIATTKQNERHSAKRPGRRSSSRLEHSMGIFKRPAYNHFFNFCGQGVFTADGPDWKAKRAAVMHTLLKGYETKVTGHAHVAAKNLIQRLADESRVSEEAINVVPILQQATIGLIYRYIAHVDLDSRQGLAESTLSVADSDSISSESSSEDVSCESFDAKETQKTTKSLLHEYLQSITRIRLIILAQSRSIWFLLPRWVYRWFSSMYVQEEEAMGPIRDMARMACHAARPDSPLARLRQTPLYQGPTTGELSTNLLEETITLLFAGQDTSAATLSWTLHLLSLYPHIQTQLAEEIHRHFQSEPSASKADPILDRKSLQQLPLLDAVVKEAMRLYPVAPFVVRRLPHDLHISADAGDSQEATSETGATLPRDTLACIWIYALHRNPRYWDIPDDFVPSRWMQKDKDDPGHGTYMPFAQGPRNCVGQPLAQVIVRSILAHLIHRFVFVDERLQNPTPKGRIVDPKDLFLDMQAGFTVLPLGGVPLRIHDRQL